MSTCMYILYIHIMMRITKTNCTCIPVMSIVACIVTCNIPYRWIELEHTLSCRASLLIILCQNTDLKECGHCPIVSLGLETTLASNQNIESHCWDGVESDIQIAYNQERIKNQ